ncbi:hypothetical protein [Streptomyces sp. NPDC052721]|uniref:hypothetical protein n=1 Tax=Streptomyces sp. NPDC052721 TaxID=3154955 RepID=UPI0034297532
MSRTQSKKVSCTSQNALTSARGMECFLLLAEELHFGRTADRMRLSRAWDEPTGYGLVWRAGHTTGAVQAFARAAREVAKAMAQQGSPGGGTGGRG